MNRRIYVIIKPTDGCNLRCKYCYHSGSDYRRNMLDIERVRKLFALLAAEYDAVDVTWHGGEPLLCGLDYFTRAMEIENELFVKTNTEFNNTVQTNGTLITAEWAKFFKKYRFGVGISFDGMQNDRYRGGTERVQKSFKILKKAGVHFGCMAVVADDGYDLLKNYLYFAERGIPVAFSPMFGEGAAKGMAGVTAENYVQKTNALFDYWLTDGNGVNNKLFSGYVAAALGSNARVCTNGSCLGKWIGVCPDGDIYNCGRAEVGAEQYRFGNIDGISSISELFESDGFVKLLRGCIARRNKCKDCEYFEYCAGGCADTAIIENGLENIPEFYCKCFKGIFSHVRAEILRVTGAGTPLSELNPAVRATLVKCMAEGGGQ